MACNFSNITDNQTKKCFIITPIGNPRSTIRKQCDTIIESAIKPALITYGFSEGHIYASHNICDPGDIDSKIVTDLLDCDLVIANLTNNNPNVLYELAIRHFIGKPVILLAHSKTKLPFDVSKQRVIFFDSVAKNKIKELQIKIENVLTTLDNFTPSNVIYKTAQSIGIDPQKMFGIKKDMENIHFIIAPLYSRNPVKLENDKIEKIDEYIKNYNNFSHEINRYEFIRIDDESVALHVSLIESAYKQEFIKTIHNLVSTIKLRVSND